MHPRGIAALLLATLSFLLAGFAAGCGSDDGSATTSAGGPSSTTGEEPAVRDVADADPEDVEVIEGWIGALSEGDVDAAAGYFAIPSTAENGTLLIPIRSTKDAVAFNSTLPCGGELIKAETTGDFTTATFELTERPEGGCGPGIGGTASTAFVIEDGKITDWRRVAGSGDEAPPGSSGGDTV